MSVLQIHLPRLQDKYPAAAIQPLPNGTTLVVIPGVVLPSGWNRPSTTVYFLTPVGYPIAQPDCFWTDSDLRLANGVAPKNSGVQQISGSNQQALWFSWHPNGWNPNKDDLRTYLKIILDRLKRAE